MNASADISRKTLRQSLWQGVFSGAVTGFTQDYFTPFLLLREDRRHVEF